MALVSAMIHRVSSKYEGEESTVPPRIVNLTQLGHASPDELMMTEKESLNVK